jgi:hypothetical protein
MYMTHVLVYSLVYFECIIRTHVYQCMRFTQTYFITIKLSLNKMPKEGLKILTLNSYYRQYHQLARRKFKVEANLGTLL